MARHVSGALCAISAQKSHFWKFDLRAGRRENIFAQSVRLASFQVYLLDVDRSLVKVFELRIIHITSAVAVVAVVAVSQNHDSASFGVSATLLLRDGNFYRPANIVHLEHDSPI